MSVYISTNAPGCTKKTASAAGLQLVCTVRSLAIRQKSCWHTVSAIILLIFEGFTTSKSFGPRPPTPAAANSCPCVWACRSDHCLTYPLKRADWNKWISTAMETFLKLCQFEPRMKPINLLLNKGFWSYHGRVSPSL